VRLDRYDLLVSATHVSPRVNLAFQVGGEAVLSSSAGLTRYIQEIGVALPALEPTTED